MRISIVFATAFVAACFGGATEEPSPETASALTATPVKGGFAKIAALLKRFGPEDVSSRESLAKRLREELGKDDLDTIKFLEKIDSAKFHERAQANGNSAQTILAALRAIADAGDGNVDVLGLLAAAERANADKFQSERELRDTVALARALPLARGDRTTNVLAPSLIANEAALKGRVVTAPDGTTGWTIEAVRAGTGGSPEVILMKGISSMTVSFEAVARANPRLVNDYLAAVLKIAGSPNSKLTDAYRDSIARSAKLGMTVFDGKPVDGARMRETFRAMHKEVNPDNAGILVGDVRDPNFFLENGRSDETAAMMADLTARRLNALSEPNVQGVDPKWYPSNVDGHQYPKAGGHPEYWDSAAAIVTRYNAAAAAMRAATTDAARNSARDRAAAAISDFVHTMANLRPALGSNNFGPTMAWANVMLLGIGEKPIYAGVLDLLAMRTDYASFRMVFGDHRSGKIDAADEVKYRAWLRYLATVATDPIAVGISINVRRSNGDLESGWKIVGINPDGTLLVASPAGTKTITREDVLRANPKLADG